MVKRPIQHRLETRSRVALEARIPDRWHFQRPDSDYGIDGEILIFNPKTDELKNVFLVQLKSSAQFTTDLTVHTKTERLRDFTTYDSPVFIVGWNDKTHKLYYINATDIAFDPGSTTTDIRFTAQNEWVESTPSVIENIVERRKVLLFNKSAVKKVRVTIENLGSSISKSFQLQQLVSDIFDSDRKRFIVTQNSEYFDVHVHVSDEAVRLQYFGLFSRAIILSQPSIDTISLRNLILCSIVIHLYELALPTFTSDLIREIRYDVLDDENTSVYHDLFKAFLEHDNLHGIKDLGKFVLRPEKLITDIQYLHDVFIFARQRASREALKIVAEQLTSKMPGEQDEVLSYNIGNLLMQLSEHKAAAKHFVAAFRGSRGIYTNSGYAFRDFAACLFESGRYHFASIFYKKALSLDGLLDWFGLLGDALFFNRRFDEAANAFQIYGSATTFAERELHDEWELKKILSSHLHKQFVEASTSDRSSLHAPQIIDKVRSSSFPVKADDLTEKAAQEMWFERGVYYSGKNNLESCVAFALSAIILKNNITAWANAFLSAFNWYASAEVGEERAGAEYLIFVIYQTGRFWIGRQLDASILEQMKEGKVPDSVVNSFVDLVRTFGEEADRKLTLLDRKRYLTLRVFE